MDRQEGDTAWTRVNSDMLPGLINAPMGGEYQLADPGTRAGTTYQYRLINKIIQNSYKIQPTFAKS